MIFAKILKFADMIANLIFILASGPGTRLSFYEF